MTIQMPKLLAKLLPICGLLGLALLAVACRGGSEAARGGEGPGGKLARAADQGLRKAVGLPLKGFTTVFTIVLENQDYEDVLGPAGKRNAPYINSLAERYGLATNYHDSGAHPSLPNYLYMVSGSTHGVRFRTSRRSTNSTSGTRPRPRSASPRHRAKYRAAVAARSNSAGSPRCRGSPKPMTTSRFSHCLRSRS